MSDLAPDFSQFKSTSGVIREFGKLLEKAVMTPEEQLYSSPASFVNLHMSTLGKLSAYSFYEGQIQKREINPSTAVQMRSLLRHLDDDEIGLIYGKPASMMFVLAFSESDIIKMAVRTQEGISKLVLNKDLTANILDYPQFTLDHNIEMFVTRYSSGGVMYDSVYAKFDTSDKYGGSISAIENPFIISRVGLLNGKKHFFMYVPMRQYIRQERIYEFNGKSQDLSMSFENNIMGFQLIYKELGKETSQFKYKT